MIGSQVKEEDEDEDEDSRPRFGARGTKRSWDDPEDDSDGEKVSQRDPTAELPTAFGAKSEPRQRDGGWLVGRGGGRDAAKKKDAPSFDQEGLNRLRSLDTGGKALKMLQKMGWQGGGLGAHGQGIKTAITAVKRADKEGLGTRPERKQTLGAADEEERGQKKKVRCPFNPSKCNLLAAVEQAGKGFTRARHRVRC